MHRNKQMFPVLEAQAEAIEMADDLIVKQCISGSVAIETTCVLSGYSKEVLAEKIGKAREVLSRASSGRGGLDVDVLIKLMRESGSTLILQYMAHQLGGEFRFLTDEELEIKQAEEHLASLKAKRQAA
jgi:hypothetical protein